MSNNIPDVIFDIPADIGIIISEIFVYYQNEIRLADVFT